MGLKNGDRSYKMELKPKSNIPSYHVLFGQKVTVRYPGQKQTCGRCFNSSDMCMGGGVAKRCENARGQKRDFSEFIPEMWQSIQYAPADIEIASLYDDHGETPDLGSLSVNNCESVYTPMKSNSLPEQWGGLSVRNFPREDDEGEIMEFLFQSGLPETLEENVKIGNNGTVTISQVENALCQKLISDIHLKKYKDRKIKCFGVIPVTPNKDLSDLGATQSTQGASGVEGPFCPPAAPVQEILEGQAELLSVTDRRKSVKELVTDFSSCISSSEGDNEAPDWVDSSRRQRKKKRMASKSPEQVIHTHKK